MWGCQALLYDIICALRIDLKTEKDISIAIVLISLGLLLFLPTLFSEQFIGSLMGRIWIGFSTLLILLGLLKVEQVEIVNERLTKRNLFFNRSIDLKDVIRFKVKTNDMNHYPQYNIAAILKFFNRNGNRYSNFRFLTIYSQGKRKITIDERTMSTADFNVVLKEVKKRLTNVAVTQPLQKLSRDERTLTSGDI